MDARLQRRIQRYGWDKAVKLYDQHWQEQLKPAQDLLLDMAALQPGEKVLDVAAGTGLVTFAAARRVGDSGEVLGTDISERMIKEAEEIALKKGIRNVAFERADAETLNLKGRAFDVALCALGLMYVPYPVEALRQMRDTLRTGGRCVAAVWGQRDRCGWAGIFPIVDARVNSEVCPLFFQLGTGDILRHTFEQASFRDIHLERITTTLHYDSDESACGAAFAGGPVALAYSRFNHQIREEAHVEYLQSIQPFRNGNGYHIPGEFVVVSGVK